MSSKDFTQDGHGIKILQSIGIDYDNLVGHPSVAHSRSELDIEFIVQGSRNSSNHVIENWNLS